MNFLKKLSLKNKEKNEIPVEAVPSTFRMHPFTDLSNYSYYFENERRLYKTLRTAVPIIDAAINKTVRLIGNFKVKCNEEYIEKELNDFLRNVKVNATSSGINSFLSSHLDELLTYGTAVGEIVLDHELNCVSALYNASLSDVELELSDNPLKVDIFKKTEGKERIPVKNKDLILVSTLNAEPGCAYGNSILKGLPFVSSILLNIYNTIGLNWERVGNVRFSVTYKPNNSNGEKIYTKERVMQIAKEWSKTMHCKDSVNDFISVGDVDIKVIGADNQVLDSNIPVRQMLEQIVAKMSIPPFLLGLSWSTTERMSSQQADILTSELEFYRNILEIPVSKICKTFLRLNNYPEDLDILWDNINLQDEVELANARLTNAKAKEIEKRLGAEV